MTEHWINRNARLRTMQRIEVLSTVAEPIDEIEKGLVHYDGVGSVGTMTLCGHVDRVGWQWTQTTKRVNCTGCIAVRDHVLGR